MKKIIFICAIVFALEAEAQPNNFSVNDTLRYFSHKQTYRLPPTTSLTAHPFFKSLAPVSGSGPITHIGSVFKNKDTTLKVYGLEGRALVPGGVSQPAGVPFRLYLCNVVNGLPVLPPLDSVSVQVFASQPIQYGVNVGGTFTNSPVTVKGDFAVLARCVSNQYGDTVNIFRTAGHTATSTSAPTPAYRFGEGLGVVRNGGVFYTTTNYNHPAFGPGTDYEFCLAPMVTFTLQVNEIESETMQGACLNEVFTNTSTSSPELSNRQFNFNEFYRRLKPFDPQSVITTSFTADSVLTWDLGNGSPFFYLDPDKDTIQLAFSGNCNNFFTGSIKGKYKQSAYNTNAQSLLATVVFSSACVICDLTDGVAGIKGRSQLKIYPNPTIDKTVISGLEGVNTVAVYNMMGQMISSETIGERTIAIDLTRQPKACYVVRISDSKNNSKLAKIIKE